MSNNLKKREVDALAKVNDESRFLQGDYVVAKELAPDIGEVTLIHLLELGLLEAGHSDRYRGEVGYRITLDGERLLYGATW